MTNCPRCGARATVRAWNCPDSFHDQPAKKRVVRSVVRYNNRSLTGGDLRYGLSDDEVVLAASYWRESGNAEFMNLIIEGPAPE